MMSFKFKVVATRFGKVFAATVMGHLMLSGVHTLSDVRSAASAGAGALLVALEKWLTWEPEPALVQLTSVPPEMPEDVST